MEEELKKLTQQVFDKNSDRGEFGNSQIPFHKHTGADSPQVSYNNLSGKYIILPYTLFGTQAATAGNYSTFFTAPVPMSVKGITEVHAVKGTDGSAVSLQIEKLTGTTAPGSGTSLLTTAFDLKGNINTVVTGLLTTTVGYVQMNTGDRLALLLTGTPTTVANVTVTLLINF